MKYYIFKLKFISPVRFGSDSFSYALTGNSMTAYSDTLFSAICNEWKNIYGIESLVDFVEYAQKDEFLLSDLLPYKEEELFIPKPVLYLNKTEKAAEEEEKNSIKKKMKKINYIPVSKLKDYINYLKNGGELPVDSVSFGENQVNTRVALPREDASLPYYVSGYNFADDSGLYFILNISENYLEPFQNVLLSLGETGIGGKKSSGFGKFILREEVYEIGKENKEYFGVYKSDYSLAEYLTAEGKGNLSLSLVYPEKEDLEGLDEMDTYSLLTRKGFVYSEKYADEFVKRKSSVAFRQGSVFSKRMKGQILDLSIRGTHPVYRYGKGLFLGGIDNE